MESPWSNSLHKPDFMYLCIRPIGGLSLLFLVSMIRKAVYEQGMKRSPFYGQVEWDLAIMSLSLNSQVQAQNPIHMLQRYKIESPRFNFLHKAGFMYAMY